MITINPELFRICLWQIHTIYTRLPNGAISGVIAELWESIFGIAWSSTDSHKSVEAFRHVGWKVEHQQSAFGLWPNTKDKVFCDFPDTYSFAFLLSLCSFIWWNASWCTSLFLSTIYFSFPFSQFILLSVFFPCLSNLFVHSSSFMSISPSFLLIFTSSISLCSLLAVLIHFMLIVLFSCIIHTRIELDMWTNGSLRKWTSGSHNRMAVNRSWPHLNLKIYH